MAVAMEGGGRRAWCGEDERRGAHAMRSEVAADAAGDGLQGLGGGIGALAAAVKRRRCHKPARAIAWWDRDAWEWYW